MSLSLSEHSSVPCENMEALYIQAFLFLSVNLFLTTEGLRRCYECTDMPFPRDCTHLTMCGDADDCFLEQVVTSGGIVLYNSGCKSKSRCTSMGKRALSNEVARSDRAMDIVTCATCCSDDFCNNQGCGQTDVPRDQRGPICFSCDNVIQPSSCTRVSVCTQTEFCALMLRADYLDYPEDAYQGFCQSQAACDAMVQVQNNSICSPTCCSDDYCNVKCGLMDSGTMPPGVTDPVIHPTHPTHQPHHTTKPPTTTTSPCKTGTYYDDISGICIRVVAKQMYTQSSAKHACSQHGERLVVIDTHEKMVFIMNVLLHNIHLHYNLNYAFWVGLERKDDRSPFVWNNGQPLTYTYWGGGDEVAGNQQPDNIPGEHCVMIYPKDHFMWADAYCSTQWGYICEEDY